MLGAKVDGTGRAAVGFFKCPEMQSEPQLLLIGELLIAKHQNSAVIHDGMNCRDVP